MEIKRPLTKCPDYNDAGDEAYFIDPEHTIKDVLRFCFYDSPEDFMYLCEQVFLEENENCG